MALTKVSYSMIDGAPFNVLDYGADPTGVSDSAAAIQAAINAAAVAVAGSTGAVVYLPTGTYLIGTTITLPNRVGLQGANGRGTTIKPHSSFASQYMFHAVNGTSSMFASWIRDMFIDGRGKNMIAPVYSQAWQETCGMDRVLIYFDGTTNIGFLYTDGYGGAALLKLRDMEIFSDSSYATAKGIQVNQVSLVGAFVLMLENSTIAGSATNKLALGVNMANDSLLIQGCHFEDISDSCVQMGGAGHLSADTLTGSTTYVNNVIAFGSGFTGFANLRNINPNGAVGLLVDDNATGRNILGDSVLPEYVYQNTAFSVGLTADQNNVTGNGTEYTILFNNEVYDYLNQYNPANGRFTAGLTGKYLLSCCVKLNVPAGSTLAVIRIATSNKTYEVYRGSFANQRDTSGNVTINGTVIADMDVNDIAFIQVTVSGIGADTVDVLASDGSVFSGQWLSR
jgi:hypothetical protein